MQKMASVKFPYRPRRVHRFFNFERFNQPFLMSGDVFFSCLNTYNRDVEKIFKKRECMKLKMIYFYLQRVNNLRRRKCLMMRFCDRFLFQIAFVSLLLLLTKFFAEYLVEEFIK